MKSKNLESQLVGGDGFSIVLDNNIQEVKKPRHVTSSTAVPTERGVLDRTDNGPGVSGPTLKVEYKNMFERDRFYAAYHSEKSKPGNMTKATDSETLDGFSEKRLDKIIAALKDRSFQFKPSKRVYIPKANGKLRPLGIPSPMDKIVQKVYLNMLEGFESIFLDSSHGFRPGRSCHTAIKEIYKWKGTT